MKPSLLWLCASSIFLLWVLGFDNDEIVLSPGRGERPLARELFAGDAVGVDADATRPLPQAVLNAARTRTPVHSVWRGTLAKRR